MRKISLSTFSYLIFFTLCISLVVGFYIGKNKPKDNYAMTATVVAIYEPDDTVIIKHHSGVYYSFKGVEDWAIGDEAACVMNGKWTDTITDDEIINVRYCGVAEWQ
jgi:hypothetical protein